MSEGLVANSFGFVGVWWSVGADSWGLGWAGGLTQAFAHSLVYTNSSFTDQLGASDLT